MNIQIPPIQTLKAFESASRLRSFSRAAEELSITPAAVSHQIRLLEDRLGVRLFKRNNNKVYLTAKGENYLPSVREALDLLSAAGLQVRGRGAAKVLNVSVLPIFAIRWLIPRLLDFQEMHPEIELRISTTYRLVDFGLEDFEAAVRYGDGNWPGLTCDYLFQEKVLPVCSAAFLSRCGQLRDPSDLRNVTLLHSMKTPDYWKLWLSAVNAESVDPRSGMRLSNCLVCFEAACQGLGVALINQKYADPAIADGRLVAPFDMGLTQDKGWYFVCPKRHEDLAKVAIFREWLHSETR